MGKMEGVEGVGEAAAQKMWTIITFTLISYPSNMGFMLGRFF
jgi:hypothetical protein